MPAQFMWDCAGALEPCRRFDGCSLGADDAAVKPGPASVPALERLLIDSANRRCYLSAMVQTRSAR